MTKWIVKQVDNRMVGIAFDGSTYTALTFSASKTFKTWDGAARWLRRYGYEPPRISRG